MQHTHTHTHTHYTVAYSLALSGVCAAANQQAAPSTAPESEEAAAEAAAAAAADAALPEWAREAVRRGGQGSQGRNKPWKVVLNKEQVRPARGARSARAIVPRMLTPRTCCCWTESSTFCCCACIHVQVSQRRAGLLRPDQRGLRCAIGLRRCV